MNSALIVTIMALIFLPAVSHAESKKSCHGHFVNPITDVCWSCIFPITLGKAIVAKSKLPDTKNSDENLCHCPGRNFPGMPLGFWEPAALVDVTRVPYCMTNLGGIPLTSEESKHWGVTHSGQGSFYQVHWYHYPLLSWLGILADGICMQKSANFDVLYLSELDPTWQSDLHATLTSPEAMLFANKQAQAACGMEAARTKANKLPIDSLPWCAGAQGSLYPLTGFVAKHYGGVQASFLLAQRANLKLHHMMAIADSGPSTAEMCHPRRRYFAPKSRYRYQLVNPVANTKICTPPGKSTVSWEGGYEYPNKGEDFGYLIWKKRNCCAL